MLVLVTVVIATTLATSFLAAQGTAIGIARNVSQHASARFVAESGLDFAVAYIRQSDTWRDDRTNGTWVSNESFAGGTFTIVGADGDGDLADDAADLLTLTATGTYGGATHIVRAVVTPVDGAGGSGYTYTLDWLCGP